MSEVPEFPTMIQNRASLATYLSQSHPRHSSSKSRPLLRILCRRSFGRAVRPEIRAIWKNWTSKTIQNQIINWILRLVEFVIIPSTEQCLLIIGFTFTAPCNVGEVVTSPVCDIVSWHKKSNSARNKNSYKSHTIRPCERKMMKNGG